jgi:D-alanyl-D-alanine endopeptidase (penicillin-binding protein 7)
MNNLIHAGGWALIHFLWQGALIGGASAALLWLMRDARPGARYAVSCAALLACLLWPAYEFASALQTTPRSLQALVLAGGDQPVAHSELLASIDTRLPLLVGAGLAQCAGAGMDRPGAPHGRAQHALAAAPVATGRTPWHPPRREPAHR